ncbi:MAG: hypothetical protein Q9167_007395 [Letrouitia subvulpina]
MPNRYSYALVLSDYQSRGIIEKSPLLSENSASPLDPSQAVPSEQTILETPTFNFDSNLSDPVDFSVASTPKDQPRPSHHSASSSVITEIWAPQNVDTSCAQSHAMTETSNEGPLPAQYPSSGNSDLHDQKTETCSTRRKNQPCGRSREKIIMRSSNHDCHRRRSYKRLNYEDRDTVQDILASMQPIFSPAKNTSKYSSSPSNYGDQNSGTGKATQELPRALEEFTIDETALPNSPNLDVLPWEYSPIILTRNTSSVRTKGNKERTPSQTHAQPAKLPDTAIERSGTMPRVQYSQSFAENNAFTALGGIETQRPTPSGSWTEELVFPTYPGILPAAVSTHTPVGTANTASSTEVPRYSTSLSPGSFSLELHEAEHVALAGWAEKKSIEEGIWFKGERKGGRCESPDDAAPPPIKLRRHKGWS